MRAALASGETNGGDDQKKEYNERDLGEIFVGGERPDPRREGLKPGRVIEDWRGKLNGAEEQSDGELFDDGDEHRQPTKPDRCPGSGEDDAPPSRGRSAAERASGVVDARVLAQQRFAERVNGERKEPYEVCDEQEIDSLIERERMRCNDGEERERDDDARERVADVGDEGDAAAGGLVAKSG